MKMPNDVENAVRLTFLSPSGGNMATYVNEDLYYFFKCLFIFERERDREWRGGGRERRRHRI